MGDGESEKVIEAVRVDDYVASFERFGDLKPRRVTRLYQNTTEEWVELSFIDDADKKPIIATPGHAFLSKSGEFFPISSMIAPAHVPCQWLH